MRRRTASGGRVLAVLVAGGAAIALYPLLPGEVLDAVLYDVLAFAGAALAYLGGRHRPPPERRAWYLLALGPLCFGIGDVIWDVYEFGFGRNAPTPSFADAVYVAGYGFLILAGVNLLIGAGRADLGGPAIDALIVALGMALVWFEPLLVEATDSVEEAVVAGIYPVGDVAVFALFVTVVVRRRMTVAGSLLLSGMAALLVADVAFLVMSRSDSYVTGRWPDLLFMAGPLLLGTAALAPDVDTMMQTSWSPRDRLTSVMLACAASFALPLDLIDADDVSSTQRVTRLVLRVLFLALVAGRLFWLATREASAHDELMVTSTRLKAMVENSADAVVYTQVDGTILEWNPAAERLFGVGRHDMVGTNLLDHFDLANRTTIWREAALPTEDVVPLDLRGTRVLVRFRREPVQVSGGGRGYIVTARDATKQLLAEGAAESVGVSDQLGPVMERFGDVVHDVVAFDALALFAIDGREYRALATLMPGADGVCFASLDGTKLGELDDAALRALLDADARVVRASDARDGLYALLAPLGRCEAGVVVPLDRGGSVRAVLVLAFTSEDAVSADLIDLVDALAPPLARAVPRILTIEAEREAVRNLKSIEAVREHFLQMVAHEIRSPLGAVGIAAEALRDAGDELPAEEARELAQGIAASVRRLAQLARDLVAVSRVEAGFPCNAAEVHDGADMVAQAACAAAADRIDDLELQLDVDGTMVVDRVRVEQVVTNLVVNACNYSRRGQPVEVEARLSSDEFRLAVRDHGIGVPQEETHRVFDRFVRLSHEGLERPVPGTGLGLFISKAIVDAHGGRIWVHDTPGGGATFEVALPCRAATSATVSV